MIIAAKFITLNNAYDQALKNKIFKEIKKEFTVNDELQRRINALPEPERQKFYTSKINISKLVEIVDDQNNSRFAFISDIAPYGDLTNFFFNLVTENSDLEDKILKAFYLDPASFLSIIVERIRDCILAMHELHSLHLDVAARNFLVYDFEYHEDGKLKNIEIKISDMGRSQLIHSTNESAIIEKGGPVRYMDKESLTTQTATVMSDIYSFKVTLISLLGTLVGEHPNTILAIKKENPPGKKDVDKLIFFKQQRIELSDDQTLQTFLENVKDFAEKQIKFNLKMINLAASGKEVYLIKYKLAEACLAYIHRYASYFVHKNGVEISHFMTQDNLLWNKLLSENTPYQYRINFLLEEVKPIKTNREKKKPLKEEDYDNSDEYVSNNNSPSESEEQELMMGKIGKNEKHIERHGKEHENCELDSVSVELQPEEYEDYDLDAVSEKSEQIEEVAAELEKKVTILSRENPAHISSSIDQTMWKKSSSENKQKKSTTESKFKPTN